MDVARLEVDLAAEPADRDRSAAAEATDEPLVDAYGPYGLVIEEVDEFDMVKLQPNLMQSMADFHVCSARPIFPHSKDT